MPQTPIEEAVLETQTHFSPEFTALRGPRLDQFVDRRIDAADKEAGDAGNPTRVAATRDQVFKAREIGLDDVRIAVPSGYQSHCLASGRISAEIASG